MPRPGCGRRRCGRRSFAVGPMARADCAAVRGWDRLHLLAYERLFEDEEACRLAFARIFGVSTDGPPLSRRNESSAAQRRAIAMQHLHNPADADHVEVFFTAWADTRAIVAALPGVRAFIERHSLDLWRAVAGRSDGPSDPRGALPVSLSGGSVRRGNTPEDTA